MKLPFILSTTLSTVLILGLVSGCAKKRIIIDKKGVSMAQYAKDKRECEQYAEEINVAEDAARRAGAGAVVGGAIGAVLGDSTSAARRGAGAGAVSGGAGGAEQAVREKHRVVRNCLIGRGYRVLN